MKRKIVIWVSVVIILIIAVAFLFGDRIVANLIFKDLHPRKPKNQIEITQNIGWWSHQDELQVDSFKITILESKLNLFNTLSLIQYSVKGKLIGDQNRKPYIDKIHLNERFLRMYNKELHPYLQKDTNKIPEAIFEITPIVNFKENKRYNGESIPFEFTNEILIESFHWGDNWINFKCLEHNTDIILKQRK